MKYTRKINEQYIEIAHHLKHIKQLELDEAKIRTKKRIIFKELCKLIDKMVNENLKTTRKEDEENER